jgi:hypothetical protein
VGPATVLLLEIVSKSDQVRIYADSLLLGFRQGCPSIGTVVVARGRLDHSCLYLYVEPLDAGLQFGLLSLCLIKVMSVIPRAAGRTRLL